MCKVRIKSSPHAADSVRVQATTISREDFIGRPDSSWTCKYIFTTARILPLIISIHLSFLSVRKGSDKNSISISKYIYPNSKVSIVPLRFWSDRLRNGKDVLALKWGFWRGGLRSLGRFPLLREKSQNLPHLVLQSR